MPIELTSLIIDRIACEGGVTLLWPDHGQLDVAVMLEPTGEQDDDERQVKARAVEILEEALSVLRKDSD
jgi:hypothetical protein